MFDPNIQSIEFYIKDLERQMQPRLQDYRKNNSSTGTLVRMISIVGVLFAAVAFLPIA